MNNNQHPHSQSDQSQTTNYRPRSPDLSGFVAPPPPPPPNLGRLPSFSQHDSGFPPGYNLGPRGSYDASPYFSPSSSQAPSYFGTQPFHSQSQSQTQQYFSQEPFSLDPFSQPPPPQNDMARLRNRPPVNYSDTAQREDEFDERVIPARLPMQVQQQHQAPMMQTQAPMPMQPLQTHQLYPQQQGFEPIPALPQAIPNMPQVDVRTKFPVARIKRIMQADEDIGKVAQATPTAVAKALECFMIALVTKGASDAKAANSKRVTATHLKTALLNDPQYDFLKEICENAPDEGSKKSRAKSDAKSEDSDDEDIGAPAKKKKGGKRKKDDSD